MDDATGAIAGVVAGVGGDEASITAPEPGVYRPSAELDRLVRARDGGCRFPGCTIGVRHVDLDHVIPYDHDDPERGGPTTLANLACLCRRHHRIKQRPGWSVVLHPDATMTWTDPTGRTRTTWPQDHRPPPRPTPRGPATRPAPPDPAPPEPPAFDRHPDPTPDLPTRPLDLADLEPFSLLEDDLLVRLRDLTGEHLSTVHNHAPRTGRRHDRHHEDGQPRAPIETRYRPRILGRPIVSTPTGSPRSTPHATPPTPHPSEPL